MQSAQENPAYKFTIRTNQDLGLPDDSVCSICNGKYSVDSVIIACNNSSHYFHKSCIKDGECEYCWDCPMCPKDPTVIEYEQMTLEQKVADNVLRVIDGMSGLKYSE